MAKQCCGTGRRRWTSLWSFWRGTHRRWRREVALGAVTCARGAGDVGNMARAAADSISILGATSGQNASVAGLQSQHKHTDCWKKPKQDLGSRCLRICLSLRFREPLPRTPNAGGAASDLLGTLWWVHFDGRFRLVRTVKRASSEDRWASVSPRDPFSDGDLEVTPAEFTWSTGARAS